MSVDDDLLAVLEQDVMNDAPIAVTLRRFILLGGRTGSPELRDWASQELSGYKSDAGTPDYRRVPAPILIDVRVGNQVRKNQIISASIIPEFAREMMSAGPVFYDGIGSIEASIESSKETGSMTLTHARAMDICASMDAGNPMQETYALYWRVATSSLVGIVEAVKTKLAEIVGELRERTPSDDLLPSRKDASEAIRIIIEGGARSSKN